MQQRVSDKILKNTVFNAAGRFWSIIVTLLLTPYIIHRLGMERFGIWAITGFVTGYFGLFDFGVSTSFVKYIAEFYTHKDYEKINQVIGAGFIFYLLLGIFIFSVSLFLIRPLVGFFNIPPYLYREAVFVFLMAIALFSLSNAMGVFGAVQTGLQRMDLSNKVSIAMSLPTILGTVFFLEKGWGLRGLIINNAIVVMLVSLANIVIAFRLLPQIKFNPFVFKREVFGKLFSFGSRLYVAKLADLVSFQADKVLISHFLQVGLVTFYQLGSTVLYKARDISTLLVSAVLPAASELDARKEPQSLQELYQRSYKYIVLVGLPVMSFIFLNNRLIMFAWMGRGYEMGALTMQILAAGYLANLLGGPAALIGAGIGKPQIQMKAAVLMAAMNLSLSIIFIVKFGFLGAASATALSLICAHVYHLAIFHRQLNLPLIDFWRKMFIKPLVSCFAGAIVVSGLRIALGFSFAEAGRKLNLVILTADAVLFFAVYLFVVIRTKYLDFFDQELIKRMPALGYFFGPAVR